MTKPRINKTDLDGTPKCPHCDGDLWQSTVTVAGLMEHWPIGGWLAVGDDGYAREDDHLTTHCGECRKPVAVGFNSDPNEWHSWQIKFAAAVTDKDREYLDERAEPKEWR